MADAVRNAYSVQEIPHKLESGSTLELLIEPFHPGGVTQQILRHSIIQPANSSTLEGLSMTRIRFSSCLTARNKD